MQCIKDWIEIVYYIAFIILTVMLVWYARKTYVFESSKSSKLLCKIYTDPSHCLSNSQPFMLEVYNFGNDIAHDIKVGIFGLSNAATLDFLKPGESAYLAIGFIAKVVSGHRVFITVGDSTVEFQKEERLSIQLSYADFSDELNISLDSLFMGTGTVDTSTSDSAAALQGIEKVLASAFKAGSFVDDGASIQKRLDKISDAISKKS